MVSLSAQYLQSPCEIKSLSNDLLTTAFIDEIEDDYIKISTQGDILPTIHCDTPIKINVYNNNLGFKVLIGKVFLSTPDFMKIVNIQNLADFEQRNFFRIKVDMDAKAYLIQGDIPSEDSADLFKIHICDISLSGFFIRTKKKMEIGQRMVTNLNLKSKQNVPFCCQVQRIQPISVITNGYGCAFLDNSNRQFDLLCKFIFDLQREQIRQAKESQL